MNETPRLCNQLNDASGFGDLPLCLLADPSCAHYQGDCWESALTENFAVTEGEEIEDWDGGFLGVGREVFFTLLNGDEGPELMYIVSRFAF